MSYRSKINLLIVDDDNRIRNLLGKFLKKEGFNVQTAASAEEATNHISKGKTDIIVLDVLMPGKSGYEFTKHIRKFSDIPVLMMSALGESANIIEGLSVGADDYVCKPFDPMELLLRIENIIKRMIKYESNIIKFGYYSYNFSRGELYKSGEKIELTDLECRIIRLFARNIGKPVSRDKLAELFNGTISERTVDVQIARLRAKIEKDPSNPSHLKTVRGHGYKLST